MPSNQISNEALRIEDVPLPDADRPSISRFARTYDGYQRFAHLGKGKAVAACGKLANTLYGHYLETGELPGSLDDLRTCLFFENERWRKELDPRQQRDSFIIKLIDKIRNILTEETRMNF
jgi:hypothetical protein